MEEVDIRDQVIIAYRALIEERYDYESLVAKYEIPQSFSEEKLAYLKDYFLDYIYPTPKKRASIDEAFDTLQSYTSQPGHLLNLLKDSTSLLFSMGWQLPKILKAGLSALKSFNTATKLEQGLISNIQSKDVSVTKDNLEESLKELPRDLIDGFMVDTLSLFETMEDRKLVDRVLKVVTTLIGKMKDKPSIYGQQEIQAVSLGKEIIQAGNKLYDGLNKQEQKEVFQLIANIERDYIDSLFES